MLPGHREGVVVTEGFGQHHGGQRNHPSDQVPQGAEQTGDAPALRHEGHVSSGRVLASLWTPWTALGRGRGLLLGLRFGLAGRVFGVAAHDPLDAERKRAPWLDADQGVRVEGPPWHRLALATGKEPLQAMRVLTRFGGHDFIAHQPGDLISTVAMLTKAHPQEHGPRERLGAKVLDSPVTAAWTPAQRDMPPIVTRPVMTSKATTIRLK